LYRNTKAILRKVRKTDNTDNVDKVDVLINRGKVAGRRGGPAE
jgi:hypothetical protein